VAVEHNAQQEKEGKKKKKKEKTGMEENVHGKERQPDYSSEEDE